MHVLGADDNEGPETVQPPPLAVGVEVETVASSLGIAVTTTLTSSHSNTFSYGFAIMHGCISHGRQSGEL